MALVSKTRFSSSLAAVGLLGLLSLGACATEEGGPPAQGQVVSAPNYRAAVVYGADGRGFAAAEVVAAPGLLIPARFTPPERVDGLLSSPPNDAHPGECYAKVVVPGQPIAAPPPQPHAVWVQTPPRPGQVGPTWCIVYEAAAPQPMAWTPERYGWIRVICDKDATVSRIRHIQQRLHTWGYYDGGYEGRYDGATAHAVARFQERRHIEHGGVLSIKTIDALDDAPPPAPPLVPPIYRQPYPSTFAGCGQPACSAPVYQQPIYPQPVMQQPVVIQQPIVQPQIIRQPIIQQEIIQQPVYQQQIIRQPVIVQQPVVVQQPVYSGCGQPACGQPNGGQPCGGPACAMPAGYGWGGPPQGYGRPQGYGPTPPYRGAFLSWPGKTTY